MITQNTSHATKRAVGVFNTRSEVEKALQALKKANFNMNQVGVIARDLDEPNSAVEVDHKVHRTSVENKADEGAVTGALTGGALGGITGLLVGLGTLAIPGIGPILLAGAGATTFATTLAGTAIGAAAGGFVGALVGLGIPEERAQIYSDRISQGHYLVMVTGDVSSVRQAETILHDHGIQEWDVYDVSVSETTNTTTVEGQPKVVVVDHRHRTTHDNVL